MKVYTYDAAPNARRLTLFMQHKGIELETQQIDLGTQEQLTDAYKAINPLCTVPALVLDDGTVLTEVIGICTYLEGEFPDKPLLGRDNKEKGLIMNWDHRLGLAMTSAIADVLRNWHKNWKNRALPGPQDLAQIPELADRGRLRLHAFWPQIEAHLASSAYVVGEQLSFADIDLLVGCEFAGWVKESIPEDCSHTLAWLEKVKGELAV